MGSVVIFIGVAWAVLEALRVGFSLHAPRRMVDNMALGLEFFILSFIIHPPQYAFLTV